jgi:general secretion pathway protein D
MNDTVDLMPEGGPCGRPQRRRRTTWLATILVLAGLWLWLPQHADGQPSFGFSPIGPKTNGVGILLSVPISVTNAPFDGVTFGHGGLAPPNSFPANASLDSGDGTNTMFSWTPSASQTGVTTITVWAYQRSQALNSNYTTFYVTVTNPPVHVDAPSLTLPLSETNIEAGTKLTFTAYATNTDDSFNALHFTLPGAPNGAGITDTGPNAGIRNWNSGQFTWTPTGFQANSSNYITVVVTETLTNGSLSNAASFSVIVDPLTNNCADYTNFLIAVEQGGVVGLTNCQQIVLSNTVTIATNVIILAPYNMVTIAGNNLLRLFIVLPGANLILSNVTLLAGRSTSGGAIFIEKGGAATALDCTFEGNTAVGPTGQSGTPGDGSDPNYGKPGGPGLWGWPGLGGAICNKGDLAVDGCSFLTNSAVGGSGGNGGNGPDGTYQGGNGGAGGNGNVGYGGAIYNAGTTMVVTNCTFLGNTAIGGAGGAGGTNGNGVFNGYPGNGGSGNYAAGGAICSRPGATIEASMFNGNLAQAGSSAAGGTAGGGYGVNGPAGGNGFGGAVCLIGASALADCQFITNTVVGGNGGNGGDGNYGGGNGGDGGSAIGGCLYNFGKVTVVNCSSVSCISVAGTNGSAGSGPFPGLNGIIGKIITNRIDNRFTNGLLPFGAISPVPPGSAPGSAVPSLVDPATVQPSADSAVPTTNTSDPAGSQTAPAVSAEAASSQALPPLPPPPASNPTGAVTPAPSSPGGPTSPPAGLPTIRAGATNAPVTRPPGQTNAAPAQAVPKDVGEQPLEAGLIDFRGADLNQVLDIYSMLVSKTLLRPATLPAPTIILKTQGQLTVREGIQALEAVLALNGITMVPAGEKFVKVVAEAQSGSAAAAFNTNSAAQLPDLGQYVTHVVQLKYAKPSELVPILTPFVKIPNAILPLDANMILVLRDYAENVKRMLEMVNKIDVAVPSEFVQEVIAIKYAKASEIAGALNSLSSAGGGASIGAGGGSTTGGARSTSRMGGTRSGGMGGIGGAGGVGNPYGGGAFGQQGMNPQGTVQQGAGGNAFTQRLQNIINRASTSTGEIQVIGQTKIISDERTNSLLIFASREDMKVIKDIVAKLDIVLAQVLIESAIISVSLSDSHDLGFSYLQHPQNIGSWTGVGALNNKTFQTPQNYILNANGVTNSSSGVIPGGFSYLMSFGQDLDVAVAAAASDTRARILQRPRIQTSHNEPASIFVGESRPYPTSSYYGGGAYGGYSSIQQLEIGVSLDVTPLINPDGLVVLDIHQKIDSFEGNVTIANVGDVPITSEKEAQAKVSVRDHDTIILGGLIETDKNKNKSGVPFLMDIPMLGYLFRSSHADETRQELIVLIRPTVLPTPEIAALTATAEKNKMPGVRATEKELRDEEVDRLKKAGWGEPVPFQMVKPQAKPE